MDIARRVTVRRDTEESSQWGLHQHWAVITHFPYSWIRGNGGAPDPQRGDHPGPVGHRRPGQDGAVAGRPLPQARGDAGGAGGAVLGTFREGRLAMGVMEVNNLFLIPQSQAQGGAQFKWDVQQLPAMEKGRYSPTGASPTGWLSALESRPGLGAAQAGGGPGGADGLVPPPASPPASSPSWAGPICRRRTPHSTRRPSWTACSRRSRCPSPPAGGRWTRDHHQVLARIRAGAVSVNEGLSDLDRQAQRRPARR